MTDSYGLCFSCTSDEYLSSRIRETGPWSTLRSSPRSPTFFVVPSAVILKYFEGGDPATWRRARYREDADRVDRYKNNWAVLKAALRGQDT